jgi:hypothetical protein
MTEFQARVLTGRIGPQPLYRLRHVAAALVLVSLAGCAELAGELLDTMDLGGCYGCNWVIQEWDDPNWTTHNSDPYETEEQCERVLARIATESDARGYRCVYQGDREALQATSSEAGFCYGCDWAVQIAEYGGWQPTERATYKTEGKCQEALWHQAKLKPGSEFRCVNLDL